MADTHFVNHATQIQADWLNDVNTNIYKSIINVKLAPYNAKGDGVTNDGPAIQAAINAANASGGGIVYCPPGTYLKPATSAAIIPKSNVILRGAGKGATIFKHDDTTGTNRYIGSVSSVNAASNFAIEDCTFEGMWSTSLNSNGLQIAELWYITGLRIQNVEVRNSRSMGMTGRHCTDVLITGCHVKKTNADGFAFWDTSDIIVTGNSFEDCDDDAISLHTNDSTASPLRAGVVVANNTIKTSQGIKVLGAKSVVISNNVIRRCYAYGIYVDFDATFNQGDTPHYGVMITNNIVNDIFKRAQGGNAEQYYMRIGGGQQNAGAGAAAPGRVNTATGQVVSLFGTNLGNFQAQNTDDTSVASPGGYFWLVKDNILARTLPAVAAYSDWGFGELFSGNQSTGSYNGAITEADLNTDGIRIESYIKRGLVESNIIATTGDKAIHFNVGATPPALSFDDFTIRGNKITDYISYGIFWPAGTVTSQGISVIGNEFDADPRLVSTNRGTTGTWLANTVPAGVYIANGSGFEIVRNEFKNLAIPVVEGGSALNNLADNVLRCDPVAIGFSTANKGIGNAPRSGWHYRYIIEGSDPTSVTFGTLLSETLLDSNVIPSTGKYIPGHITRNVNPSVAGGAGSQYIIWGWLRVTLGTGHVLNTDWREMRTLTGT